MSTIKQNGQDIKEMVLRVLSQKDDWGKHLSHSCQKCEKCTCGKHKCKLNPMKIGLAPTHSTYQDSFQKRDFIKCERMQKPTLFQDTCQFIRKSEYRTQYDRKKSKPEKQKEIKGKGNIQFGGPSFLQTTYHDTFTPKNSRKRSQIRNPSNLGTLGLKMNTQSSYKDTFKYHRGVAVAKPIKRSDNLKTQPDINFLARSNYTSSFENTKPFKKNPQIDNFAPTRNYQSVQGCHHKSSYQCDYSQKKGSTCPAAYL